MEVVDATPEHIEAFLTLPIRQVDVDEWVLASGQPLRHTLLEDLNGLTTPPIARALLDERGVCICLWGVQEDGYSGIGSVWLVASLEAERRGRAIHRLWRREVALMHERFATLVALSYHRNTLHHDWLRTIGFDRKQTTPLGPFNIPYAVFVRRQENTP